METVTRTYPKLTEALSSGLLHSWDAHQIIRGHLMVKLWLYAVCTSSETHGLLNEKPVCTPEPSHSYVCPGDRKILSANLCI